MPRLLLILGLLALPAGAALAFGPPGLWDPAPLDQAAGPNAAVGAALAGTRAAANARAAAAQRNGGPETRAGHAGGVSRDCSLDIASLAVPSRGLNNSTIVLQAEINAPIVQVCR